jgi:hypothetical protein
MINTDEPGVFSAEVPLGPIRSTETIASPPHGAPACREIPTACASQARELTVEL